MTYVSDEMGRVRRVKYCRCASDSTLSGRGQLESHPRGGAAAARAAARTPGATVRGSGGVRSIQQAHETCEAVEERRVERADEERPAVMVVAWRRPTGLDDERGELTGIHAQCEAEIRLLGRRLGDARDHGQVDRDRE